MARAFALAGLLRLRRVQQDAAAGDLARANGRLRDNTAIQARARRSLEGFSDQPTDVDTLRAIAAARASSSSMLAELAAATTIRQQEAAQAEAAFFAAKTKTVGIEKLDEKHTVAEHNDDLRMQQLALDEIASNGWQRRPTQIGRAT
ncbi:MAG: Flagellar export protein FliJ [Glaciihabitans sp.]|nr:Flagellar export protein FliJ [Glaciihabitans sp.]